MSTISALLQPGLSRRTLPQFLDHELNCRYAEEKERRQEKDQGKRPLDEDPEIPVREHQRLPEGDLQFRAKHQGQQERGSFVSVDKFDATIESYERRTVTLEKALSSFKGTVVGVGATITVFLTVLEIFLRFVVKM